MKVSEIDYRIAMLILYGAAIQNRFFDEMFVFLGMDLISLLLSVILILTLIRYVVLNYRQCNKKELVLMFYCACVCMLGFVQAGISKDVLLNFRTLLYFLVSYLFFKNIKLNEKKIIALFRKAGLINSGICLIFYFINVGEYGARFRDVSINLYFSLFSVILYLFVKIPDEKLVEKYVTIFLCMLAIFTSQQRTQIIPLITVLVIYIFNNIGFEIKKLIRLFVMTFAIVCLINIASEIGMLELVLNRLKIERMVSQGDTLAFRMKTTQNFYDSFTGFHWIFGTGLTGKGELEMLVPNYIYKYGFSGTGLIFFTTISETISRGIRFNNSYKRQFLIALLIMSIGGFISGFGGQNGQLFIASIVGCINNKKISEMSNIDYKMTLCKIKLINK